MIWKRLRIIPILAISIFVILYIYASLLYPGGSQADVNSIGFDWINNYWCDLLFSPAGNGEPNPAMPYAITANILLGVGVAAFFFLFPQFYWCGGINLILIRWCGSIGSLLSILIFTPLHDMIIGVSSLFGLFALIAVFIILRRTQSWRYFYFGIFCLIAMLFNNVFYYSGWGIEWLPLTQKIGFVFVLSWIVMLNLSFYRKKKGDIA